MTNHDVTDMLHTPSTNNKSLFWVLLVKNLIDIAIKILFINLCEFGGGKSGVELSPDVGREAELA